MARFWIGPWEWRASRWQRPAGSVYSLDLRSRIQCATPGPVPSGSALFVTPNAVTLAGYTLLGQAAHPNDVTLGPLERTAWRTRFGLLSTPAGPSLTAVLMQHLLALGDPTGDLRCLPLIPSRRRFELWLANVRIASRAFDLADAGPMLDMYRRHYRRHRQDVLDGLAPPLHHLKVLGYWVRKYGIDYRNFQPSDLPDEPDLPPDTTITESFNKADADTLGPDLTWTETQGDIDVVANQARTTLTDATQSAARAESDLSSDDHYAQAVIGASEETASALVGTMARKDPAIIGNYYYAEADFPNNVGTLYKEVGGLGLTTIGGPTANTFTAGVTYTVKCQADGSTIKMFVDGTELISVTDTAITGYLRTGLNGSKNTSGYVSWDSFEAADLAVAQVPWSWVPRLGPILAQ